MPALAHAAGDSPQRKVYFSSSIAGRLPAFQSRDIRQTTERTFERKTFMGARESVELTDYQAARPKRGKLRLQWGQPTCNEIGVYEVNNANVFRQELTRKRCLSRSVRSCDDNAARSGRFLPRNPSLHRTRCHRGCFESALACPSATLLSSRVTIRLTVE